MDPQPAGSRLVDEVAARIECKFDALLAFPKDLSSLDDIRGLASTWSIPTHPQDMQALSLLRNFVNPVYHFGELTPSQTQI